MTKKQFYSEMLQEILVEIDEEITLELGTEKRFDIVILGGSALLLAHATSRPATHDIDILKADAALTKVLSRHPEINSQVEVYADRLPAGFEKRLVQVPIQTRAVNFCRPSLEDLVVMKLYSWREQDQIDLFSKEMLQLLNFDLLEKLIYDPYEAQASSLTKLMYDRMVETYEKRYRDKALKKLKRLG